MSSFSQKATARTPEILLDADAGTLVLSGESYPEDVTAFYSTLQSAITTFFDSSERAFDVSIKLTYFNSSSARSLMELLDLLDNAAGQGRQVSVQWYCDAEDDITREFAQDISSDVTNVTVTICDLEMPDAS